MAKKIDTKYTWKTSDIYENEQLLASDIEKLKEYIDVFSSFKGKLNSRESILEYFVKSDEFGMMAEKMACYVHLKLSENREDQKYIQLSSVIDDISTKLSVATSYISSELKDNSDEFLMELCNDKAFQDYKLNLMEIVRNKPHILPESEERIVSLMSDFSGGYSEVFDNIDALDVKFSPFKEGGKTYKVTNSNLSLYLENISPAIREKALKNLTTGYKNLSNTIATNYIQQLRVDKFYSTVSKFDSTLAQALFDDNLPEELYNNLIHNVNKHLPLLHKYLELRKKALKLDKLKYSDLRVSLIDYKKDYTYDEMCSTIVNALQPMGSDYVDVVKHAIESRWIDVYPTKGKDTGGYCLGVYGVHPYIMLNTVDNMDSMFTLIHEMGHAMHSYLSDKHQPYNTADYAIFLAEIASTTNEVLLIKHLYKNATSKQEKIYLLDKYLQMFRTTIFRQTMFSEFEDYAHKLVENGEPISKSILCSKYKSLNNQYHGESVEESDLMSYEWLRIPHFYRSYYVYKYATGLTSATCIASRILKGENVADYIKFLSSGGCDYPNEILKKLNIDLTTSQPYEVAFGEMKWAIEQLESLV